MAKDDNFEFSTFHRDGHGNVIGSERRIKGYGSDIHDAGGSRIGSTNTFGTFDRGLNRKSDGDDPGLLWKK